MPKPIFDRAAGEEETTGQHTNFIGVYAAADMDNYLSLAALAGRKTKSRLLREILSQWYSINVFRHEDMVRAVAEQAYHVWGARYKHLPNVVATRFEKYLRQELERHKLSPEAIEAVVTEFKNYAAEDIGTDETKG